MLCSSRWRQRRQLLMQRQASRRAWSQLLQRHAILTVQARQAAAEAAADAAPSDSAQQATDPVAEVFVAEIVAAACARWSQR